MRRFHLLTKSLVELLAKTRLVYITDPLVENISIAIQKIEFRLDCESKFTPEIFCSRIACIQVNEIDPAGILCFKPMHDGRHGTAGTSGEAEKFNQLQPAGSQVDCHRITGNQL